MMAFAQKPIPDDTGEEGWLQASHASSRQAVAAERPTSVAGSLELRGVTKRFSGGVTAVDNITMMIGSGEFVVLVGPSGCGKSTLLRMIAGLVEVSAGTIAIGGRDVTRADPGERDIAMVFQNYALYPHMSVRQNLGYGLKVRKTPKAEIGRRVAQVARMLMLEELLDRRPAALSGGQCQRVAIGRAIVREPSAFLMDEPLSNLDAKLRVEMRAQLAELHARLGTTTVYVTHDQVEAMTLGHRVAVMREGRVLQFDTPQALYSRPTDLFVGTFIGSPTMNVVEATIDDGSVAFAGQRIPLDPRRRPAGIRGRVILGIRPEAFQDAAFAASDLPQIEVSVSVVEDLGSDAHVIFHVDAPRPSIENLKATSAPNDERLFADGRSSFNARVDPRTTARPGEKLRLAVDPTRFYFFDVETGVTYSSF